VSTAAQARDVLRDLITSCEVMRDDPPPVITLTLIGKGEWTFTVKAYTRAGTTVAAGRSTLLFWVCEQTDGKDMSVTSPVPV